MKASCALVFVALAVAAHADDYWIVNGTRSAVVAVQWRVSGERNATWKAVAQRGPLGFNERAPMPEITSKCSQKQLYDIQVLFDDGHRVVKTKQALCRQSLYKITDH